MAGVSLVELMITLLLGLLVTGAAVGIFISNKRAYAATESLGRVQEGARVAFELMARDIREAAGNPCNRNVPVINVLNASTDWWATWGPGVTGYNGSTAMPGKAFGTGNGDRITGTDAIDLRGGGSTGVSIVSHNGPSARFQVSTIDHGLNDGDIAMVCDFQLASIFQVTNAQPGTNDNVVHNPGGSVTPGNQSRCLNLTPTCNNNPNNPNPPKVYGLNSTVVKMRASRWYVGACGARQCLYQSAMRLQSGAIVTDDNPIIEGVTAMELRYLTRGGNTYDAAAAGTNWAQIEAVRVTIRLEDEARVGTAGERIQRTLSHIVTLRNRVE